MDLLVRKRSRASRNTSEFADDLPIALSEPSTKLASVAQSLTVNYSNHDASVNG